ncbi:radical SAM-associated putative lipoprotein [Parabacteroides sp. Marseille-P3160]|uniref:radical SAM-associated putative lipoprotein n=1 Tax=Parabacteroides sp. Marseille-P3160 TaxID=1917887 RepID=UPI0009B969C6|nr:radical SAM-associated putative lipoprotein [Parabacteroides sp. Marseille-P3160]
MKKIHRKLIKGTNWALAGIISLLGFSACSDDDEDEDLKVDAYIDSGFMLMYGTIPTTFKADIILRGRVVDENGTPVPHLQFEAKSQQSGSLPFDEFRNDKKGEFKRKYRAVTQGGVAFELIAKDTDGELNGGDFKTDTTEIIISNEELQEELVKKNYVIRLSKKTINE